MNLPEEAMENYRRNSPICHRYIPKLVDLLTAFEDKSEDLEAENKKLKHKLEIKGQAEREYFIQTLRTLKAMLDRKRVLPRGTHEFDPWDIDAITETIDDALNLE